MRLFNFNIFASEYESDTQTSETIGPVTLDIKANTGQLLSVGFFTQQDDIGAAEEDTQAGYGFSQDSSSLSGATPSFSVSLTSKPQPEIPGSKDAPGDPNHFAADIIVVTNDKFEG